LPFETAKLSLLCSVSSQKPNDYLNRLISGLGGGLALPD
jgi:hypothetical protein